VILSVLRDFNIEILPFEGFNMITRRQPAVWEWIDKPSAAKNLSGSFLADLEEAIVPLLSFPVRYQLEVCISQGCLNEYNLTSEFVDKLAAMDERKARDLLEYVADSKSRVFDPMALFHVKAIQGLRSGVKIPYYCVYTRKATITPSMIYYNTPTVETSNRVIRQYVEHADRFLRVQFSDEKFQVRYHPCRGVTHTNFN
jgi:RNA-dependent RNA polymerase